MHPDSAVTEGGGVDDVGAAVDDGPFLVADLSRDDAWLSVSCDDALAAYR